MAVAAPLRSRSAPGRWAIAATVLGSGMASLDATVVGIALPTIGREFHADLGALQWVVTGYTLTLAAFLLPGARAAVARPVATGRLRIISTPFLTAPRSEYAASSLQRPTLRDLAPRPRHGTEARHIASISGNIVIMKFQKQPDTPPLAASEAAAWFAGRLPEGWFTTPPEVVADAEEILVVGSLSDVDLPETATDAERATARAARIAGFRQDTRDRRIRIALEAEHRFGRKVSWGAVCGDRRELFTTLSVPFMTRLRQPERAVLDTLVEAGVARSRSEALAWCVRLVGRNQSEWIENLRAALSHVERARAEGPEA